MSTNGLLRGDMVNICLGDAETTFISRATANTVTVFIDRREVVCIFLMTKIQGACIHDGIAKTLYDISKDLELLCSGDLQQCV